MSELIDDFSKRDIPSINFVMHQTHCQRNIKLCEHCKEPVPRSEMEAHFEEEHKKVSILSKEGKGFLELTLDLPI